MSQGHVSQPPTPIADAPKKGFRHTLMSVWISEKGDRPVELAPTITEMRRQQRRERILTAIVLSVVGLLAMGLIVYVIARS